MPTKWRRPRAAWRRAPASRDYRSRVPERRADAGALDRPRPRRPHSGAGRARRARVSDRARSASSATTPKSCSTSTCRPRRAADAAGASLRRTESLNTSPTFIADAGDLVRERIYDRGDEPERVAGRHRRRRHRGPCGRVRAPSPWHLLHRCSKPAAAPAASSSANRSTASRSTRGPDALLVQKPEGIRLCEELGSGIGSSRPSRRASPSSSAAAGCIRCRPRRCSAFPPKWGPFIRTRAVLVARQAAHGRGARSSRAPRRRRRIDRRVHDAALRHGSRRPISPSRCWPAFMPATSIGCRSARCFRASVTPSGRTAACCAAFARQQRRTTADRRRRRTARSIAARRAERAGRRARRDAARRTRSGCARRSRAVSRQRIRVSRRDASSGDRRADAVVLASPAYATARIVRSFESGARRVCATRFRTPRPPPWRSLSRGRDRRIRSTDRDSSCPASERTGILAASWLSSKWPDRAPDDRVLMRTFVGGARDPQGFEATDAELVARLDRRAAAAARHHRRRRCSRASTGGSAPARSTRSVTRPARAHRARRSPAIPGCSSPAAAFAASGFPTASPTAAPRREGRRWLKRLTHRASDELDRTREAYEPELNSL